MTPLIRRAVAFYEEAGYEFLDLPCAPARSLFQFPYPQASESFFVVKALQKSFPTGRYAVLTPEFDSGEQFVELFRTDEADKHAVEEMIMAFSEFARRELRSYAEWTLERHDIVVPYAENSVDLDLNAFHVARYGLREYEGLDIAFGTGLSATHWQGAVQATVRG